MYYDHDYIQSWMAWYRKCDRLLTEVNLAHGVPKYSMHWWVLYTKPLDLYQAHFRFSTLNTLKRIWNGWTSKTAITDSTSNVYWTIPNWRNMPRRRQLFVGRLPRSTTSRDLEDIFYRYGRMTRCDVKSGKFFFSSCHCESVPVSNFEKYPNRRVIC